MPTWELVIVVCDRGAPGGVGVELVHVVVEDVGVVDVSEELLAQIRSHPRHAPGPKRPHQPAGDECYYFVLEISITAAGRMAGPC